MARVTRFLNLLDPRRWTAALVSKELRVAGRRRRNYALRCLYVLVLMIFMTSVWVDAVEFRQGMAQQQTQMARAAKEITSGIVWFQFIAVQIVTLIVMSTAISDEIYGRTLSVLMTTPLSSRQLILGKLVSRLVPVAILVATSLPLLAIIRVLGGVPWAYLWVSLAVTLATVLFVGSVTLLFSTLSRKMYMVVITSGLSVAFLMGVTPFLIFFFLQGVRGYSSIQRVVSYVNPFVMLQRYTEFMASPMRRNAVWVGDLVGCCLFLIVASAVFLLLAMIYVRRVALRRVMGQSSRWAALRPERIFDWLDARGARKRAGVIRRVVGPPMIWKELTCTLTRRQKFAMTLTVGVEVLMIAVAYLFPFVMAVFGYELTHLVFLWAFLGLGMLFTLSTSATLICAERESGAWPVLLMTPLRDRDILIGKCVGMVRRCGPVWLPLLAYVVAFTYAGCFHPLAIVQTVVMILSVLIFLSATGFYFGTRFTRTTEAVTANLILAGVLWLVLPMIAQWLASASNGSWDNGESFAVVPFAQVWLMMATALEGGAGRFWWFHRRWDVWEITQLMLGLLVVYALVGQVFFYCATRAFRRRIL